MRTLAANVRELQSARGLSTAELARRCVRDVGMIKQLRSGLRTNPSLSTLCLVARALEVPVGALLLGVSEVAEPREARRSA